MTKLALLGDTYPTQLRVNPRALGDLEVVWTGTTREAFLAEVPPLRPHVLALDFVDLGQVLEGWIPELLEASGAQHALVSYRLTNHPLLRALTSPRIRFIQGPVPLSVLRTHVQTALEELRRGTPVRVPRPPRFTQAQLAQLLEIATALKCECPNHLSQLISGLQAFEEYSRTCENKDEKDRRVHAVLYRQTALAREAMEDGLAALLEAENIRL